MEGTLRVNKSLARTPNDTHDIEYFKHMPSELKKLYLEMKKNQQEAKKADKFTDKDHLKILQKIKKQRKIQIEKLVNNPFKPFTLIPKFRLRRKKK